MIMTQLAMMDPGPTGHSWFARCCRAVSQFFGFGDRPNLTASPDPAPRIPGAVEASPLEIVSIPAQKPASLKWRRHEQLLNRPASTLENEERLARQSAVRGLFAARAGEFDEALSHFTHAARCATVDLTEVPGFWTLPRHAMIKAITAYEATGRLRDASALGARIRQEFRPRVLASVPRNVTELPTRPVPLSGNS